MQMQILLFFTILIVATANEGVILQSDENVNRSAETFDRRQGRFLGLLGLLAGIKLSEEYFDDDSVDESDFATSSAINSKVLFQAQFGPDPFNYGYVWPYSGIGVYDGPHISFLHSYFPLNYKTTKNAVSQKRRRPSARPLLHQQIVNVQETLKSKETPVREKYQDFKIKNQQKVTNTFSVENNLTSNKNEDDKLNIERFTRAASNIFGIPHNIRNPSRVSQLKLDDNYVETTTVPFAVDPDKNSNAPDEETMEKLSHITSSPSPTTLTTLQPSNTLSPSTATSTSLPTTTDLHQNFPTTMEPSHGYSYGPPHKPYPYPNRPAHWSFTGWGDKPIKDVNQISFTTPEPGPSTNDHNLNEFVPSNPDNYLNKLDGSGQFQPIALRYPSVPLFWGNNYNQ